MDDKYPSWRDALFSNGTVANIRCAIKYIIWHGGWLLMAIAGAIFFALYKVWSVISRSSDTKPVAATREKLDNSTVRTVSRYVFGALITAYVAAVIAWAAYMFIHIVMENPGLVFLAGIVVSLLFAIVLAVAVYGGPYISRFFHRGASAASRTANRAGKRAVQTPGIRRVYGECPVSMDLKPKWYTRIFGEDEL